MEIVLSKAPTPLLLVPEMKLWADPQAQVPPLVAKRDLSLYPGRAIPKFVSHQIFTSSWA